MPQPAPAPTNSERFIGIDELMQRLSFRSRQSVYTYMKAGVIPKSRKVGVRKVAWLASEVDAYFEKARVS